MDPYHECVIFLETLVLFTEFIEVTDPFCGVVIT